MGFRLQWCSKGSHGEGGWWMGMNAKLQAFAGLARIIFKEARFFRGTGFFEAVHPAATGAANHTAVSAVKGEITGNLYRFGGTGARLEVDRRDAAFMTGIPDLVKRT